ncbi:MAG TPA: metal ABC transporter permease, partial [Burkholderiaceae bacterium]
GYYLACGAAALVIGRSRRGSRTETAAIGIVQTVGLAAGYLFLSLNHAVLSGLESLLFGDILGVSSGQVAALLVVAAVVLVMLAIAARPLLFATIDRDVAQASGVPAGALDVAFLLILGLAVAATSQVTGALLVFALLVAPAATAQTLTTRPLVSLALSIVFALLVAWLGLGIAYFSIYPVGFYITSVAFGMYLLARIGRYLVARRRG